MFFLLLLKKLKGLFFFRSQILFAFSFSFLSTFSLLVGHTYISYTSSENISQAKRGYDIAVKRYEVGGGTLVDVDNSQLAYTQAELSRSTAIFNYLINQVSLDKIKGTYSQEN